MNKTQNTVPTIHPDDTARTRRSDPATSHAAADRSQRNLKGSAIGVLRLVLEEGELPSSEINWLYRLRRDRKGWPMVADDSPRKRASELCEDGYLEVVDTQKALRLTERVFAITEAGKRKIGAAA